MSRLVSSSPISPDRSFHPKSGHARLIHKHGRTRARFKLMYCRHYVSSRVNTKNRSTTIRRDRAEFRRLPFSPFPRRRGEERSGDERSCTSRLKARGSFLGAPWKCMHVAVFAGLERDVIDHRLVKIRPETFAEFSGIRHRVSPPRKRARSARAEIPLTNSTTAGNASRRDSGYRVCTSFPKPGTRLILYRRCVSS